MKKINIIVPDLPESVSDATVVKWHKKIGDEVNYDDNIVDIETDKVMLEVSSPCNGTLQTILEKEGAIVKSQQILGQITKFSTIENNHDNTLKNSEELLNKRKFFYQEENNKNYTPSIRRLIKIHDIDENYLNKSIKKSNKISQENIIDATNKKSNKDFLKNNVLNTNNNDKKTNDNFENRVKMTRLRQKIAERLLDSKNNTAMLTTFNEVNVKNIVMLRQKYGEIFKKEHGIRMGFMSFFVKAVVESLKKFPEINASIDGTDIIYYKNFDISIAISTPRGLITPVLKNADTMSIAEIEKKIKEFSIKGMQNKININELIGGNFTITNGGVFGSLMSTPIINPPQAAILGMHAIQDRAMVINGKIKILPMMYLALSYDHRLIDGKESVGFLMSIKNILEDFNRLLIGL